MLVSLHIQNFVLIDDCRIEFHPGLNVLTGETGAGKSILAGALSLLVGERGSSEDARDPGKDALIEAFFELNPGASQTELVRRLLEESGIPWEEGTLLISRILSASGRNRLFINHSPCLIKLLKEVGDLLMDLHGQHEHQSLLQKSRYRPLLDRYGQYAKMLDIYRETYVAWQETLERLRVLEEDERERRRREDTLRFQVEEIDHARLAVGEDEEIPARLQVIQHAEKLHEWCTEAVRILCDGDEARTPVQDELDRVETLLLNMERLDASMKPVLETWQPAAIALREAARELQGYQQSLEFDPDDLDALQQRHFLIKNLKNKYGASIEEVLAFRERIHEELHRMEHSEEEREELQKKEIGLRTQVIEQGRALHQHRYENARKTAQQIGTELNPLGMNSAQFLIDVNYRYAEDGLEIGEKSPVVFGPEGCDDVEFLISTIPDKPPRPLREVASGGEISRIMLAIKCVFGQADAVPLMVFDEIDVGVGGRTADAVAERLAQLSREKQVLCITHLPQIASRADRNLRVNKQERDGRLFSTVSVLEGKDRETELARMLGGEDSAASKRFAREMLKSSKR